MLVVARPEGNHLDAHAATQVVPDRPVTGDRPRSDRTAAPGFDITAQEVVDAEVVVGIRTS
jgi:hypothetical protein